MALLTDQAEVMRQAQAKISAARREAEAEAGIVVREVWSGGYEVYIQGAPSPDGRYLSYSDSNDVAFFDLTTGTVRALTHESSWRTGRSSAQVLNSVFSPDGQHIAYAWQDDQGRFDLRIVGIDGSTPRIVYQHPDVQGLQPNAWFPDGKTLRKDASCHLL